MQCANCQSPNPDSHKFCGHCGQPLTVICGGCGFANEPANSFCGGCGAALKEATAPPPEDQSSHAERRQLTVMFCDLVGSTALSEKMDPEDLRDVLSTYQESCRRHINRYGGYIARYMGDGLLVYFGYPHAHERDPERAVRAGLDIVADVGRQKLADGTGLQVRVGIATGLVVVGDLIGEGASEERAVLGDTPNLAARLQGLAAPGSVVVAHSTFGLLADQLAFKDLGLQALKGISGKVRAYQALGDATPPSGLRRPLKLVGRDRELAALQSCWQRASDGQGQVVAVTGDAGFGKSHLVRCFRDRVGRSTAFIEIKASEFHQDTPLRPVRHMLQSWLKALDGQFGDNPKTVLTDWLAGFPDLPPDAAAILSDFLGLSRDSEMAHDLDGAALKTRTLETLVGVLETLARRQPRVMIVEDAQWLDASTLEFLGHVAVRAPALPLLMIFVTRGTVASSLTEAGDVLQIALKRLSPADADAIIQTLEGENKVPPAVRATLIEHADGIPLYIEELTRSVLESDPGHEDEGDITVPTSLQDSLMARLDRLGSTKLVAQRAAVIGRVLDRQILQQISGPQAAETEHGLLELLSADILIPRSDLSEGLFEFRHALVRDIAYQSLLIRRRRQIHKEIAEACLLLYPETESREPELIAFHYSEAQLPEKALPLWRAAAEKASARWANAEAISYYTKALTALGQAHPEDARQEVELLLGLVGCMRIVDRFDDAFAALARAETLAENNDFKLLLARLLSLHGNLCFPIGRLQDGIRFHTRARDLAEELGAAEDQARAESGLGDAALFLARAATGEHHYNTCIDIARQHQLHHIVLANLSVRGHVRLYLNKTSDALADCQASIEMAIRAKNRRAEMIARGSCLAKVYYEMGEWQKTEEQSRRALEIAEMLGARRYIPMYICFRAKAAQARGDADLARTFARQAVEINRQTDFIYTGPMTLGTLARVLGDTAEADDLLAEGEALLAKGSLSHNHLWFRLDAMELGVLRGDMRLVERHAAALQTFTAHEPVPWAEFHIQRCRLLARAHKDGASKSLKEAAAVLLEKAAIQGQNPAAESLRAMLERA